MRGASRRRAKESLNPPPPQPTPDLYSIRLGGGSRDSDASFASSRPSSVGIGRGSITADVYSDRSHQIAAIRSINTYLSSHSFPFALPPKQVPSVKDITEILKFLIAQLDYPMSSTTKLEDELFVILRCLNCPYKINKSTLRSPNSPHNWPSYLALIHWLVQIASYTDHLLNNYRNVVESNSTHVYALNSYLQYIDGDDDAVEELDREFVGKLERERDAVAENLKEMIEKVATLEELQNGPTEKEKLEKEKSVLEEDVKKFNAMVISFDEKIRMLEDVYEEKEKEIRDNVEQMKRICDENEELKKRVELQTFNARDMERMKKELATVERDIQDAETARNGWEEKCWDLDAKLVHKFNDLQALSIQCNQAIRRLNLGNDIHYVLNDKASTPSEVLGIDYNSALKPILESMADDVNKSSMNKLEQFIALQQHASELASKIDAKRNHITTLQSYIEQTEAQLNLLRKEVQEHNQTCAAEVKKWEDDVQTEAQNLDMLEREAAEVLKASELKLQETIRQIEEEIQGKARELFAIVDKISNHKEYMELRISKIKNAVPETAMAISEMYQNSLPI